MGREYDAIWITRERCAREGVSHSSITTALPGRAASDGCGVGWSTRLCPRHRAGQRCGAIGAFSVEFLLCAGYLRFDEREEDRGRAYSREHAGRSDAA